MVALYAPGFTNDTTGRTGRFGADARRRAETTRQHARATAERHLHAVPDLAIPDLGIASELRDGFERVAEQLIDARSARRGLWSASASAVRMVMVALALAIALIGVRFAQGSPSSVESSSTSGAPSAEIIGADIVLSVAD